MGYTHHRGKTVAEVVEYVTGEFEWGGGVTVKTIAQWRKNLDLWVVKAKFRGDVELDERYIVHYALGHDRDRDGAGYKDVSVE